MIEVTFISTTEQDVGSITFPIKFWLAGLTLNARQLVINMVVIVMGRNFFRYTDIVSGVGVSCTSALLALRLPPNSYNNCDDRNDRS